jgi:hypothetical protein
MRGLGWAIIFRSHWWTPAKSFIKLKVLAILYYAIIDLKQSADACGASG